MSSILIVDDSKLSRNFLKRILTNAGYETSEAKNGREAITMITQNNPDCIVLDILMPEMDCLEVLEELKSKGVNVPVIIHSADIQKSTRDKCFELGAIIFLNKPPEESKLLDAVQKAIAAKKGSNQ